MAKKMIPIVGTFSMCGQTITISADGSVECGGVSCGLGVADVATSIGADHSKFWEKVSLALDTYAKIAQAVGEGIVFDKTALG